MKAIVFDQPGDESVLKLGEAERPALAAQQIRIRVIATAVNRADLLQRQGFYPPPKGASPILGLECAGEVSEVGASVRGWKVGERAMALLPGGGYAEEAVVHAGSAMRVPASFSWEEAAALPEVFLTSFLNIFLLGRPPAGGSVLVHGGGSGIGTSATSLCREAGLKVIVTAGGAAKCERCRAHGADVAIDYTAGDFVPAVREATGDAGVSVVLDSIGAGYLESNLKALAVDGRLVIIGLMRGGRAEIDLASMLVRRLHVIGSTLRARTATDKARIVRDFLSRFGASLEAGRVRPVVDRVMPLAEAGEAHRVMQKSEHFGKIVLRVAA